MGGQIELRPDWENIKVDVMRKLIAQKFSIDSDLSNKLIEIDGTIVEGNTWGVCDGVGENMLGKLIMDQRDYLKLIKLGVVHEGKISN